MDRNIIRVGLVLFTMVGIAALTTLTTGKEASFKGTAYAEPYPPAPEVLLRQSNGEMFSLSGQLGKIVIFFFGYTYCPDVCPTTLAELTEVLNRVDEGKRQKIQVVFISVDPERDTPDRVQEYVGRFNPAFIGLSGTMDELESIWAGYGVFREIVPGETALGYTVNHTARVTLIDAQGNLRLSYGFQTPPADIVHDLEILLKETDG